MRYLATELADVLGESTLLEDVARIKGETFREVAGRRTFRFEVNGHGYFAKLHFGVGWREIFKNLIQLRLPVLGAKNEWLAIHRLQSLDIGTLTPVAYASEGRNPANIQSCIVTRALDDTLSLEEVVLANKLTTKLRRRLVGKLAKIARVLHDNGVNHRDFYICHFLLPKALLDKDEVTEIHLIDLHRAQLRRGRAPDRWREKDISGLLFSAADAGLTNRDLYRFIRYYSGMPVKASLEKQRPFWRKVIHRAVDLYERDHGKASPFLNQLAGFMNRPHQTTDRFKETRQ